jgi:hypothetical protein
MEANVARFGAFLRDEVAGFLRPRGFSRQGQRFRAQRGANALTIAFQRRFDLFTCDLGVISARLTKPGFEPREHYAIRLGPIAMGYDKWWGLAQAPETLAAEFLSALDKGLDYLESIGTDDGLRAAILRDIARDPNGPRPH